MRRRLAIVPRMKASPMPPTIVAIRGDACGMSRAQLQLAVARFSWLFYTRTREETATAWSGNDALPLRTDPRRGAHPARRRRAGGAAAAAQDAGGARRHARRPLSLGDVAPHLSRRAQAQRGRREMAGLRGGVPRLRAAP